jgi:hypothetical protein
MAEPSPYDDAGALAAAIRAVVPRLPARPARVAVGCGCLAVGVAIGPGAAIAAAVVFAVLAAPDDTSRSSVWWIVPALLRGAEYGFVVALAARAGGAAPGAAYGLLAALSFHHYDLVYRVRYARLSAPRWLAAAGGGFDIRLLLVAILYAAGQGALWRGLATAAGCLAALFVVESTAAWVRWLGSEEAL